MNSAVWDDKPINTSRFNHEIKMRQAYNMKTVPMDKQYKNRVNPEWESTWYRQRNNLNSLARNNKPTRYRKNDYEQYIKPDLFFDEIKQNVSNKRDLNLCLIPDNNLRKLAPSINKTIQNEYKKW